MPDLLIQNKPINNKVINQPQEDAGTTHPNKREEAIEPREDSVVILPENQQFSEKSQASILSMALSPFKFIWGCTKGVVKETFNFMGFFLNFVIHPIESVKNLFNGLKGLGHLILNPRKAITLLKQAWNDFKEADADQKGQIVGRLLYNLMPGTLLSNVKLISILHRTLISSNVIVKNMNTLKRFHKLNGGDLKKTILAGRKIARKENLKKDFLRSLKLEGIPLELAPEFRIKNLENLLQKEGFNNIFHNISVSKNSKNLFGAYQPSSHTMLMNSQILDSWIPIGFIGSFVRHEIKHAGQALRASKAGGKVPLVMPKEKLIEKLVDDNLNGQMFFLGSPSREAIKEAVVKQVDNNIQAFYFMPEKIWNDASRKLGILKPGTKAHKEALKVPEQFNEAYELSQKAQSHYFNGPEKAKDYKKYKNCAIEKPAFMAQAQYPGLGPNIKSPSIHNLPRLSDTDKKQEENNKGANFNQAA